MENFNLPACYADEEFYKISNRQITNASSLSPLPTIWWDFGQPDLVSISLWPTGQHAAPPDLYLGWLTTAYHCAGLPSRGHRPAPDWCKNDVQSDLDAIEAQTPELEELFTKALTFNREEGQKREVYVIGFPRPWAPFDHGCDKVKPLGDNPVSTRKDLNRLVDGFNDKLREVATKVGVAFVDVQEKFDGHRLCDELENWFQIDVDHDRDPYQFFLLPNWKGYGAIKEAFAEAALEIRIGEWRAAGY